MKKLFTCCLALSLFINLTEVFAQQISDNEILQYGFTDPLDSSFGLLNDKVQTIEDLNKYLKAIFVPAPLFYDAYDSLSLGSSQIVANDALFKLDYNLGGQDYASYSFFKPSLDTSKSNTVTLIIPGSGFNQGIEILNNVGYHGDIAKQALEIGDVFITAKPNDDVLAIHNGSRKLNYAFLTHYMLNMGGSYSASYIINSIATVKYLQTKYDRVFVIGLSQGGSAALLNSLQTSPDATVIASGFTITRDKFEWAFQDQIVIPGLVSRYSNAFLYERISKQNTNYFFSWATNEMGIYKMEAYDGYTAAFFKDLENVETLSHEQGHSFPKPQTIDFLRRIPYATITVQGQGGGNCDNDLILKASNRSSENLQYSWYKDGELFDSTNVDSLVVNATGNYSLVVKNSYQKIFATETIELKDRRLDKQLSIKDRILYAPEGLQDYEWYRDDIKLPYTGSSILITAPGEYYAKLISKYHCVTSSKMIIPENFEFRDDVLSALVYPNPNNGSFQVKLTSSYSEDISLLLSDITGKILHTETFTKQLPQETFPVHISNLQKGMYFIRLISPRNKEVIPVFIQ